MNQNKRRRGSKNRSEKYSQSRMSSERLYTAILAIIIVAMVGTLVVLVWQKSTTPALIDYEGTIVDRWADYAETQEGSRPRLNLVIESDSRKRVTVRVDANTYESARVGMRIKSQKGQIELIASDKSPR